MAGQSRYCSATNIAKDAPFRLDTGRQRYTMNSLRYAVSKSEPRASLAAPKPKGVNVLRSLSSYIVLVTTMFSASVLRAQTSAGEVNGTVSDRSGGTVAAATVTL